MTDDPHPTVWDKNYLTRTITVHGMTQRAYFAATAAVALMSDPKWVSGLDTACKEHGITFKRGLAVNCVEFADALMAELNKAP